jgi:hypothetical protein
MTHVVTALRWRNPDVRVHLRADSGYAAPRTYEGCERLGIDWTIGLGMNAVLEARSVALLAQVVAQYELTGQPSGCSSPSGNGPKSGAWHAGSW